MAGWFQFERLLGVDSAEDRQRIQAESNRRMLVPVLGIFGGAAAIIYAVTGLGQQTLLDWFGEILSPLVESAVFMLTIGVAIVSIFRMQRRVTRTVLREENRCTSCAYQLTPESNRCPECGALASNTAD